MQQDSCCLVEISSPASRKLSKRHMRHAAWWGLRHTIIAARRVTPLRGGRVDRHSYRVTTNNAMCEAIHRISVRRLISRFSMRWLILMIFVMVMALTTRMPRGDIKASHAALRQLTGSSVCKKCPDVCKCYPPPCLCPG